MANKYDDKRISLRCSFCGKSEKQAGHLVAGPDGIFICDECVFTCGDVIRQVIQSDKRKSSGDGGWKKCKGGEIRKLEYGRDDVRCVFCDKSIWDIDMVLGIGGKNMCVDCGEDFINATYSEYLHAVKNGEVDGELIERITYHASRLNDVVKALADLEISKNKKAKATKKDEKARASKKV